MARRLPPLNALRAFEAGARHLSFTRAASELNVTQSAVSHQIRSLEDYLGVHLFKRRVRQLALTETGAALLPALTDAFDNIAAAFAALDNDSQQQSVTVSVMPHLAAKWLGSRLGRFWQQYPDINLRIQHCSRLVDFERDSVDIAIRWGNGDWPGVESDFLMHGGRTPAFSPALQQSSNALQQATDLQFHTLLHEKNHQDWSDWLAQAEVMSVDAKKGPVFDDAVALIQAAIDGQGVIMGRISLIRDDVAAGRLVTPFKTTLDAHHAHYVVYPPGALQQPEIRAFRDFLLSEALSTSQ